MKIKDCVLKTTESCEDLQKSYNIEIEMEDLKAGKVKQHLIENSYYLVKLYNRDSEDYEIEKRYNSSKECKHSLFTPFEEEGEWYEEILIKDDVILSFFKGVFQVEETHGRYYSYDVNDVFRVMNLVLSKPMDLNKLEIVDKRNAF